MPKNPWLHFLIYSLIHLNLHLHLICAKHRAELTCLSTISCDFAPVIWVIWAQISLPSSWPVYITIHDTFSSHGYPTEFSNSVHWNWIYHLPTHAYSSSCFFISGERKILFPKPEIQGLSLPLSLTYTQSPSIAHSFAWICLISIPFSPVLVT